jgi:hypothetical protein
VSTSPISNGPLIVGIESSCDETGVGIVRGYELLANEVASSVDLHVRFGGVVPEVASRAHLEAMVPTLQRACATADIDLSEIDGVAVTVGPGLMGALVVGLASAKALAYALNKPLYGVNHLVGTSRSICWSTGHFPSAASRCWYRAATRRCFEWKVLSTASSSSVRLLTTQRARRTTRWRACSGCRTPEVPISTRRPLVILAMSVFRADSRRARTWSGIGLTFPSRASRRLSPVGWRLGSGTDWRFR